MTETIIETELDKLVRESVQPTKVLNLYNDDVNSFEHVINCLIKYAKHVPEQAEQCAMLVHHKGACSVKRGDFDSLLPVYTALLDNKLTVKIENLINDR